MLEAIKRVEQAIEEFKNGRLCILTDHPDRENEGDFVLPAEKATPELINFMIKHGSGIVCLSVNKALTTKLNLPLMVSPDYSHFQGVPYTAPFTISIDSKLGTATGVSASDRCKTILDVINDEASPQHFVSPGHIFPLQAREGGVLEREGHTEGTHDLAVIAGFKPAGVLCEVMNEDGSMASGQDLVAFAKKHDIFMLSISDIIQYRKRYENLIADEVSSSIPLEHYGNFEISVIKEKYSDREHIVLRNTCHSPETQASESCAAGPASLLVRVHSSCATGDMFASKKCDCHAQLHYSLERIRQEGGILIYLNQEGRGIGLFNKVKAYALQEEGYDTVEANEKLGLPVDSREYFIAANILRNLNINNIRLLTNNPHKISELQQYGITSVEPEAIPPFHNQYNHFYLLTKKERLKHVINFD